jgi:dipeptidyl aminopeptidase/acylaminoacyl peptidase
MNNGTPFELSGAAGEVIRGNLHLPVDGPGGRLPLLLVLHGFKGYKDYGFFPYLTQKLAEAGLAAARFNFSHSGIDVDPSTFGRPDLFEKDTWSGQLEDVQAVMAAAAAGQLPHADRIDADRIGLIGHSRGGVTALLAAGHDQRIAAVVAMAAPSTADYLSAADKQQLREEGYLISPSSRTGQQLHIGRAWLDDLQAHPDRLDLAAAVARIQCPLLIVHGVEDATVPVACAKAIAMVYPGTAEELIVVGANHTFNCANPMTRPAPAFDQVVAAVSAFLIDQTGAATL